MAKSGDSGPQAQQGRNAGQAAPRQAPLERVTGTGDQQEAVRPSSCPTPREQAAREVRTDERLGGTPIGSDPRE